MKAFISRSDCQMYASDGGSSVRRPMYYTGVGEAGDAAIREAQAILAVTERSQTGFGGHHVAFPVSLTLLNRDLIDDGALESLALAESLAAFVEGSVR